MTKKTKLKCLIANKTVEKNVSHGANGDWMTFSWNFWWTFLCVKRIAPNGGLFFALKGLAFCCMWVMGVLGKGTTVRGKKQRTHVGGWFNINLEFLVRLIFQQTTSLRSKKVFTTSRARSQPTTDTQNHGKYGCIPVPTKGISRKWKVH